MYVKSFAVLALLSTLIATGCTLPGGSSAKPGLFTPSAQAPQPSSLTANAAQQSLAPPTAAQHPAATANGTGVAPVSYQQPANTQQAASTPAAQQAVYQPAGPMQPPVTQVASQNCNSCSVPLGGHQPHAHAGGQCTAGCCGTAGPVYPTLPPPSAFGIDPQEFLCDGGDRSPRAMFTQSDRIVGVGTEDTVVKYATVKGEIKVEPSNRVCVYAPRFASVRRVNGAVTGELATGPVAAERQVAVSGVAMPLPSSAVMNPVGPEHQVMAKGPDAVRHRDPAIPVGAMQTPILVEDVLAALVNLEIIKSGQLREADKPWLAKGADAALVWSENLAPQVTIKGISVPEATSYRAVRGVTTYDLPNGSLRVVKMADRDAAQVGDTVEFIIRVDNTGTGPINTVELTDNLTTRMEYVEGSQTSTKDAEFSTSENDSGSLRLTWKFTEDFDIGEGAVIRFRCRVR